MAPVSPSVLSPGGRGCLSQCVHPFNSFMTHCGTGSVAFNLII